MDKEFIDVIKLIQTSLHDQISALKIDAGKALQDSEASLQIGAELEQSLNKFTSEDADIRRLVETQGLMFKRLYQQVTSSHLRTRKIEIHAGTTDLCWSLSIIIFAGAVSSLNTPKEGQYATQLGNLIKLSRESSSKIREATTIKEADAVALQFSNSYIALQTKVFNIS